MLLEATSDAYKFESVGSTFSSIPSVIGWATHEAQWRRYVKNQTPLLIENRDTDVKSMYTLDSASANQLLDKYGITYVWDGIVEKTKYGDVDTILKNNTSFKEIYSNDSVKIFSYSKQAIFPNNH